MEKRVELLAPCGSYESFLAAVNAGADAVYLGGREFGARAYAENFSDEELVSVIQQAHLFHIKVYLTVNTLVKEREFSRLYGYMLPLYEAGLDGVIVQDMGVLRFLKKNFPDLKLHASTQMTITGVYGASYLKEEGCERIVPARELSLQEIKAIKEKVPIEIEAFIHGAMCYCYSGQCLMSSMIGGRSGNRGRCAQPCRLPYRAAGKEGYFLSLKDMNTLEHIPELIEAGIDSFKIEGRMKKPEYVAGVVSIYRKYIDKYYETKQLKDSIDINADNIEKNISDKQKSDLRVSSKDKKILSDLYIRSETGSGYYFTGRGRDMLTLQKPGYNEADPALLENLRKNYIRELPKKALHIRVRCRAGEPLYGEACLSDKKKGEGICVSISGPIAETADKRSVSEEEIRGQLVKTGGTPFTVEKCEVELEENTFVPMRWVKQIRRELLQKVYEACGARNTEGHVSNINGNGEYLGEKESDKTEKRVYDGYQQRKPESFQDMEYYDLTITVQTRQQFEAVVSAMEKEKTKDRRAEEREKGEGTETGGKEMFIKGTGGKGAYIRETLIIDADLLLEDKEIRDKIYGKKINWGIKCPVILRQRDEAFLKKLQMEIEKGKPDILYCSTIDALAWVKSITYQGKIAGEASLYAWNSEAVSFWKKELDSISIPLELDSNEIRELCMTVQERTALMEQNAGRKAGTLETTIYGRTPFMVSANCIKLSSGQCDKNRKRYTELTDRMGNIFPVYTNCDHCYNIIYNCLPASFHENLWMLLQDGIRAFRMEFTTEDSAAAKDVVQTFRVLLASECKEGNRGRKTADQNKNKKPGHKIQEIKKGKIAGMETTQGRFRRPVE